MPMVWVSTIERNSFLTGSCASLAMIFRQSPSGRPAFTPRTITSNASGNMVRNRFSRRFLRKPGIRPRQPEAAHEPQHPRARQPATDEKRAADRAKRQRGADDVEL